MIRGRKRVMFALAVLGLKAAACASSTHHENARPLAVAPHTATATAPSTPTPTPSASTDACGRRRGGALTVFNRDGTRRWNIDLPAGRDGAGIPPIAEHDVILSGHAGSVSAASVADGKTKWDVHLGDEIYAMWLVDGVLVVDVDQVSRNPKVVGLDAGTGETRWSYAVPGGGFMADAALTGDGGVAFRVAETGMLTVLDTSDGQVRWSKHVADGRNTDGVPATAPGLVVYVSGRQMYGLDADDGAQRWHVPAALEDSGHVVISDNVGVVVPDVFSDPTITVVAHSLDDGAELWRAHPADISAVFPDQAGFALADYRANTLTLVKAGSGARIWQAQLRKVDNLDQPPATLPPDNAFAVIELNGVAFVDRDTGDVRQVSIPASGGSGRAAAGDNKLFETYDGKVRLVSPTGVSWTASVPHFTQTDPAALDDGGVAVESEDLECAVVSTG